jgi:DNA repair protein RecO (recombination protein O)
MTDSPTDMYVAEASRDRSYRTECIVLTRQDYGEADRILTVYTPHHGKIRIIAKGARRPTSRLGPHLDYFGLVKVQLSKGRELDVVTSAELINPHQQLRVDLDAFGHASYYAELVRHMTQDRQENGRIYDLLKRSLNVLDDAIDPWSVTRHFELALLSALGYQPELMRCVNCRQPVKAETNYFSSSLGGILCPGCRGSDPSSHPLSVNAQKYLREIVRNGLASTIRIQVPEDVQWEVERTIGAYLRYVAERDFASLRVLSVLKGSGALPRGLLS